MSTIKTRDGAKIFYKDWGEGSPVVLCHGWPLNADAWDSQLHFLASQGYRAIAHDRRGHGRSSQTWRGNDMNTYADDLAELLEQLDLEAVTLVGHATGGGEVVRYIGRHGTARVGKVALVSAVAPQLLRTVSNPHGVPHAVFDEMRAEIARDRSQFFKDLGVRFFGADRRQRHVSEGLLAQFWLQSMQAGTRAVLDCIQAFSEPDFTGDLRRIDVPTLLVHGGDDQVVPLASTSTLAAPLVRGATLRVYPDAPHGLMVTHREQLNYDLLGFIED